MTVTLDDKALATAQKFYGELETTEIIELALKKLVQSEAASCLATLGGSIPPE